ncbi:sensor histidine kinase [Cupriavidus plantarum]|uniref:histidine kinase n=1 Tax=Cupriavidus plantarum TaxID=942865 RepID=A0A316ELZ0_9BURK|nr:HAMP domain-containing sensor histidine kinase [Cupriavidus plantarum]PWK31632.1 signal transduction histidine kinase [Cupriavidus plantarum]REE85427.1 signal transduction histidine kinase [Cupriavidus plantarum]RLK28719.1 signal transduction histidine kinase [Cupriavidus plantarum]
MTIHPDLPGMIMATLAALGLLAAMHAFVQHLAIVRLAKAIERHGGEGSPPVLPDAGVGGVARLARAINGCRARNAQREAELLEVLAAYAHDLRTPLTRMRLRCDLLDDEDMHRAMTRDLIEMRDLVEASLACARLRRSTTEPMRRVDADGLLDRLVEDYRETGRRVELQGRVGQPVITCPHALRRVLVNLIDNALHYGSHVRLCVRINASGLEFAVQDSGPGIAPAEMEAVFAAWYRAPATATRAPGTGLGLAIARRLALAMRGDLHLENRHAGGLEARLTLPIAQLEGSWVSGS